MLKQQRPWWLESRHVMWLFPSVISTLMLRFPAELIHESPCIHYGNGAYISTRMMQSPTKSSTSKVQLLPGLAIQGVIEVIAWRTYACRSSAISDILQSTEMSSAHDDKQRQNAREHVKACQHSQIARQGEAVEPFHSRWEKVESIDWGAVGLIHSQTCTNTHHVRDQRKAEAGKGLCIPPQ